VRFTPKDEWLMAMLPLPILYKLLLIGECFEVDFVSKATKSGCICRLGQQRIASLVTCSQNLSHLLCVLRMI